MAQFNTFKDCSTLDDYNSLRGMYCECTEYGGNKSIRIFHGFTSWGEEDIESGKKAEAYFINPAVVPGGSSEAWTMPTFGELIRPLYDREPAWNAEEFN